LEGKRVRKKRMEGKGKRQSRKGIDGRDYGEARMDMLEGNEEVWREKYKRLGMGSGSL
jgi:hypothetical protein